MRTFAVLCVVWVLGAASAPAVEVQLTVADHAKVDRNGDVVTTGVPFAKGMVKDVSKLSASVAGKPVPAQFLKTVPWPDGSVRWALMDTQVDVAAGGKAEVVVTDAERNPAPARAVRVEQMDVAVRVSTGPLSFEIDKKDFNLFRSLTVDGRAVLTGGRGLVLHKAGGGSVTPGAVKSVEIEDAGPMRATVCVRGVFPGVHKGLVQYTVRVTAYAGKKFVKVYAWLENQGKFGYTGGAEWFGFDGLAVEQTLGLGDDVAASCEGVRAKGDLRVAQRNPGHRFATFEYAVTSGEKELKKGKRTDGVIALASPRGKVTVAVRHFWQNYEKAIELSEAKTLRVWLWPTDGEWPRSNVRRGASTREFGQYQKPGMYHLIGSAHKGHEMIFDFSGRDPAASQATLAAPLMARAEPAYYAATEAAPGWFAPADFRTGAAAFDQKLANWNEMARNAVDPDENTSLIACRRGRGEGQGFYYGWVDFGDLCWQPGTCQLHYDWTCVMLVNYLRTGERGFLDMGTEMARHRMDIDQVWSDRVIPAFRGLTRYEKQYTNIHAGVKDGYYKAIPSHHWVSGEVLYYMLTGERKARECAIRGARGIQWRLVDRVRKQATTRGQLRSTGWSILNLCSVYDLTADKTWLDEAMVLFENSVRPKWKARGPFMDGGLQYYYSTQGLCELHHRSGNDEVLQLLKEGCEKNFKARYGEWQIFLSNIYAYVGHVQNNDAYLARAKELFSSYVPRSKNPPCFKASGAWTKETAKTLRNGHILQHVLWKRAK
jgi:hypothetical protein